MNYTDLGYLRVAAVAPPLALGEPAVNGERIGACLERLAARAVHVALFPELCLTGYTAEDLLLSDALQSQALAALVRLVRLASPVTAVVGLPYRLPDGRLLNCAAVIGGGQLHGLVPKLTPPNYEEFYERRWFTGGAGVDLQVDDPHFGPVPVTSDQLFLVGEAAFAVEVCEDLWAPQPPGMRHCLAGADLLLNPSASPELVAKADYRRELVRTASARGICGYLYAGAGPGESTKDLVFGGHLLAAENGQLLAESPRFEAGEQSLLVDFDVAKLRHDRVRNATFRDAARPEPYARQAASRHPAALPDLLRVYAAHPFVPGDEDQLDARAREILDIQCTGLGRRLRAAGSERLVLGLSGGLDSTLALLVCLETLDRSSLPHDRLLAVTMPGPGTSEHTLATARGLAGASAIALREIPIQAAVAQHLADLDHEATDDVVFENAQARERTQLLFNLANKHGGLVVGTGDLSELALGWCTFNADHMASYSVNAGVPKTLVSYLVRWYARHRASEELAGWLHRVLDTPVSPELIAPQAGQISQHTEALIGPYELHDFFLFHYLRDGSPPRKIFALARLAFAGRYDPPTIKRWLRLFFERFFSQQFKRSTLPPGPKVGTVSLSPRGDWRMPDEASSQGLLREIDDLDA